MTTIEKIAEQLKRVARQFGSDFFDRVVVPTMKKRMAPAQKASELSPDKQIELLGFVKTRWPDQQASPTGRFIEPIQFRDFPTPGRTTQVRSGHEFSSIAETDFSAMEQRVMASLTEKVDHAFREVLNHALSEMVRKVVYAHWQEPIDEEGCGAAMAFLKFGAYGE